LRRSGRTRWREVRDRGRDIHRLQLPVHRGAPLPSGGRLICLDASKDWTAVARKYWVRAGVQDRIDLRVGAAIPTLQQLEPGLTFDFAFIDAAQNRIRHLTTSFCCRASAGTGSFFSTICCGVGKLGAGVVEAATAARD